MTTVAWDGTFMAADTLATDHWGLKETVKNKVLVGTDCLVGAAGRPARGATLAAFSSL